MTADDLTRLRMVQVPAEKVTALIKVLDRYSTRRRDIQALRDAAWDVIYSRRAIPPTVAALIDRAERAERERDRLLDCEAKTSWGQCAATSLLTEGADDGQ